MLAKIEMYPTESVDRQPLVSNNCLKVKTPTYNFCIELALMGLLPHVWGKKPTLWGKRPIALFAIKIFLSISPIRYV